MVLFSKNLNRESKDDRGLRFCRHYGDACHLFNQSNTAIVRSGIYYGIRKILEK